jgi:hypothetical protein
LNALITTPVSDTIAMSYHKLKNIAISQENYLRLKKLGTAGDSFNDVVTELLQNNGGKSENVVSLGSDLGLMGDTNQLHASPATGQYKENE